MWDWGRKALKSVVLKECGVACSVSLEGLWKLECAIKRKKKSSPSFCIESSAPSRLLFPRLDYVSPLPA